MTDVRTEIVNEFDTILRSSGRRDFLKLAAMGGMGAFLPAVIAGCSSDVSTNPAARATFNMQSATGPLNVMYVYAQFMFDFYTRISQFNLHYTGQTQFETSIFDVLVNHKYQQVLAFQKLVPSGRVSDTLLFNFTSIDFTTRAGTLAAAQTFEDLGVAAVNGLGPSFTNSKDLMFAGKLVSVWARHAALIRDTSHVFGVAPSRANFASDDVVNPANGLDKALTPQAFITAAQPYFVTTLSVG